MFRLGQRRVLGGIAALAITGSLWLASTAFAEGGPPTPNPLAPALSPLTSQLSPQLQALLQLGAAKIPAEDITGNGLAVGMHGDPVAGAAKFSANCAVCHGTGGVGGVDNPGSDDGTVPPLNPMDAALMADAHGDPAILARDIDVFVQHGSRPSGKDPVIEMPAWGDHALLSQADIADIEAYIMGINGVFWPDRCPGIRLELANPDAGARIDPGQFVVEGRAFDSRAQHGSGIDRIDFFLDSRTSGGKFLGTAVLGGPFGTGSSGFRALITLPATIGGHDLVAYARSSVTGKEGVVVIPIALGQDPSKAFVITPTGQSATCTP